MQKPDINLTLSEIADKLETPEFSSKVGNFLLEDFADDQIITVIKILVDEDDFTDDSARSICLGLYFLANKQGKVDDVQIQLQAWSDVKGSGIQATEVYNHGQSLKDASFKLKLACKPFLTQCPNLHEQADLTLKQLYDVAQVVTAGAAPSANAV